VVSDSYDLEHAVTALWGRELRQAVIDSGATVVIPGKRSKAGRLTLLRKSTDKGDDFATVRIQSPAHGGHLERGWAEALRSVFEDGRLLVDDTFAQIRERSAAG
jgi:nicotinamide phosphoribosyltransferase